MRTEDSIPTRGTLLDRLKQTSPADQEAWAEFDALYRPVVRAVVLRKGLRGPEVEDVVQDVMVAVTKAMPQYIYDRKRAKFRSWLFRVCSNRLTDHLRRNRRERATVPEDEVSKTARSRLDLGEDPWPALERLLDEEWRKQLVPRALDSLKSGLSPRTFQVAYQVFVKGKSVSETAELLGIDRANVSLRKLRVRPKLRAALRRLDDSL